MDLESELRKAMAEQVAGATASQSLVTEVKRRHRRRKARLHAAAGVAAASVAALALVPTYQSFRATPAGDTETTRPGGTVSPLRLPERPPASGLPVSPSSKGRPEAGASRKPEARGSSGDGRTPSKPEPGGLTAALPKWITYLPDGLAASGPCEVTGDADRRTTTCAWRGDGGWVEIALVEGGGLTGPQDLMRVPGIPGRTSVHGMPAMTGDRPDSSRQISWLARRGVGVTVTASGPAKDRLMRIAEGVRP
ncbi:hypothetical protein BKA00_004849 [Actinomadura coerulea]|uniref:Uncharacterized protein n=1 Tax=Actinomadura coerulea TaxID=46159 RepID=A0A7X0L0Y1_9ACTN|nr:hypothetical protein [Actinomadura coerulea]MBB6397935.1 hypothetical protein [Actinomadura coerulea]GGQ33369.1 hypothetical protein GCM10010187_58050 [Actinomadura coerulea]